MADPVLLWFRQDLRLADQPALVAAVAEAAVIPVYVLDDETPGEWRIGGAQRWWLHHSLKSLDASLKEKGSRLILRRGRAAEVLKALLAETGATRIHAVRHYEPWWRDAEAALGDALALHDGNQLDRIEDVRTGSGGAFKIFTPFWRALQQRMPPDRPVPAPKSIPAPDAWPKSDRVADWDLLPTRPNWSTGFDWTPGETAARAAVTRFARVLDAYDTDRNLPSIAGTSRLSPHLHHGEISPRQVWHLLGGKGEGVESYRRELAWRDFTSGLVLTMPDYADRNGRERFDALKWRDAPADLKAWREGRTGYPIVDAGMRQLWTLGLDAQPRPDDHRLLPHQAFADRLARGRTLVLGLSGRRGLRQQQRQLAVGRWVSGVDASDLLADHGAAGPVREVRRGRLYPRVGARTARPARCGYPRSRGGWPAPGGLSAQDHRPPRGARARAGGREGAALTPFASARGTAWACT